MKRLNSRINELEQQTRPDGTLTGPEKTMLVSVLARRDALFWPWRVTASVRPPIPEIRARQREYLAGSSGVSARADGRSQWKSSHETRQGLVAAGMLQAVGANGETVSVGLTPLGDATAQALVGDRLATRRDAFVGLAFMRAFSDPIGTPVRESVLFRIPCTGSPSDWEERVERMLPLLTSGVVRADSDTIGRVLFTLTGSELPEAIVVNVQAEEVFDSVYIQAFDGERNALENTEPRDPSEIYIPMSASLYWPKHGENPDEK